MTEAGVRAPARPTLARIALAGNPNTGKTTLFNRLTGSDQRVGNYPGVTVERFEGALELPRAGRVRVLDVPGTYSLSARSEEEQIAIRSIAGLPPERAPDVVVVVADATQLSRNLYLVLQVIETDAPVVVALNMVDLLEERGERADAGALAAELGVPVVPISALRKRGLAELLAAVDAVLADPRLGRPGWRWMPEDEALVADVAAVAEGLPEAWRGGSAERERALALWALLSLDEQDELREIPAELRERVRERRRAAEQGGREIDAQVIAGRYRWIDARMPRFLQRPEEARRTVTDRVDALLLHPAAGFALFLLIMGVVFQSLFSWADPAIGLVEEVFGGLAGLAGSWLPAGLIRDFVVHGLIAGVGNVVVFLPQILLLFLFIGLMEDSGYMARVAFLMDRVMRALGLHGRAFVPMMSGFACAIPGILATRTMERRRDRLLTMMVLPLMTCSARLPVYFLIIAALFPPGELFGWVPVQGLLMVAMYVFSTLTALVVAGVLGRTILRGPRVPLILELPPYRLPHLPFVLRVTWIKGRMFLKEAGTVILACTVALWLLLYFPREPELETDYAALRTAAQVEGGAPAELDGRLALLDAEEQGERLRASYGGRLGRAIEPAIEPLGFDWKIGIGLIGAFAAREVFVSTLGMVYGLGEEQDEESVMLRERIRAESRADGRPVYTPLVGLSLMVFFALACQCVSTLAVVKRETRGWRWPLFLFAYMTVLAWSASFVVYQGGRLLGFA